jgi:hypothetical protein
MKNKLASLCCAALVGLAPAGGAQAQDTSPWWVPGYLSTDISGVAFEFGCCDDDAQSYRGIVHWEFKQTRFDLFGDWYLGGYWEANVGYWQGNKGPAKDLWEFGLTPVARLQPKKPVLGTISPHIEAGSGPHVLTETQLNGLKFGSHLQFGSFAGAGVRFGSRQQFDFTYRYQHLSNAGIAEPNNGIEFHQFRFSYWFD